ncbi:hypothetical protein [Acetobacterium sp.]|uniref:hypothetical protein n=1 Tax=Acetobacterium sp. TaxID=1872094 RepID=UPI002F3E5C20
MEGMDKPKITVDYSELIEARDLLNEVIEKYEVLISLQIKSMALPTFGPLSPMLKEQGERYVKTNIKNK